MFNRDRIKMKGIIAMAVATIFALACSRGEGPGGSGGNGGPHVITDQDSIAPVVVISTPVPNQEFGSGSSISMTGRITDETGLYQGTVKLINDATGAAIKTQEYQIHGFKSYDFTVTHAPSVSISSTFSVVVSFMDHGLNTTTQQVRIKVNP